MVLPLSATDKESWEIYASYNDITEIEPAGNQVFALASNGLFSYHIKNGSVTTYDILVQKPLDWLHHHDNLWPLILESML